MVGGRALAAAIGCKVRYRVFERPRCAYWPGCWFP